MMRLKQSLPVWSWWLIGATIWVGIALTWYVRSAPNQMQSVWMWLSVLAAVTHAGRGIYAYARKEAHEQEGERRKDSDLDQIIVLVAIAAVVLCSIPLGFWVLALLVEMQR